MHERIHKATLSQSQGREGWSVIFRHPVLPDRTTGKPGRRVRRGLGTKEKKAAERLVKQLNEMLADRVYWEPSSRPRALARFHPLVVDIFYHDMVPEPVDASTIREVAIPLPRSTDSDYRQVLLLGTTGGGKTTLVRQLLGTDPVGERFPSTSTARTTTADMEILLTAGPFRAVVTFLPREEVRDYLEESMSAAALAAYQGNSEAEVLRRLLNHLDQRFRLIYVLGAGEPDDFDDEELSEDSIHPSAVFDLTGTRALFEGLGHTPDAQASLPTAMTRRLEHIDAVLLVDNAAQPMQAATVAAMRNLASAGQTSKLIFCFTHFDDVVGDNIPTFRMKGQHVLASAESALTLIGEQLGAFAERALRQRLQSASFFLGDLDRTLGSGTKDDKRTIEQLQKLLVAIGGIVIKPEPVRSRPVYDRMNLVLALKQAAEDFHSAWDARLGLQPRPGILKAHWLRIKALARRMGEGWGDEYLDLKPIADMHQALQESVYRFLQNPTAWTGPVPSDDEKQIIFDLLATVIGLHLLVVVARRMSDEAIPDWLRAVHLSGRGAMYVRARLISRDIYEKVAPLLDRTPDRNQFMSEIIAVVRDIAARYKIMLE